MLALFAAHRQWDVLPPSGLTLEVLRRYRAVVLPNVACLSDEEAATLRAYVEGGGALLATYETGCYAADGAPREQGALDDVLGVRDLGVPPRGPLPHSYARLRRSGLHGAPDAPGAAGASDTSSEDARALLAGFEGTEVLTNEGQVRTVAPAPGATVPVTLVPEIFPQPPDLSYPTLWENEAPLLVTHRCGAGKVVYFAGQTDRLNVTSGHPDHGRLLANALAWALEGHPAPVETDAPPDVHVTLLRQPATGRLYVHLVNYSGAQGRPVVAPRPAGPIRLSIDARLAEAAEAAGAAGAQAALLISGETLELRREGGRMLATVPRLERYEVLRVG